MCCFGSLERHNQRVKVPFLIQKTANNDINGSSLYIICFWVTNRRRDVYQFSQKFFDPPELIRTPRLLIFKNKTVWLGCFYSRLALFLILYKQKHLFDTYLMHLMPDIIRLLTYVSYSHLLRRPSLKDPRV